MNWLRHELRCGAWEFISYRNRTIGANAHEAKYAQSNADFINKLEIALKECIETEFWLEILGGCNAVDENTAQALIQECGVIHRMLSKSINTAKQNTQ